ncbi:hypothetical protein KW796_02255 [Candidatus Parcubacteria bacterium]|nr:hypothetical protein [Candidatus Parcubacteria bacterium]
MTNLAKNTYKNHGRLLGWGSSPEADWKVMFSLFLILVLIAGVLSAEVFYSLKDGESGEFDNSMPVDLDLLRKTALYYDKKVSEFKTLQNTAETAPDPSI